ncbi:hypothetical protein EVAR_4768_1 [Eumeta japonica]|uniref:Uncharacterized protein n=1 Tax=Eumeta variegata TaxID=151549 RepID=A0A4C1SYQ9_EUMVA|nr:hypothetical protein EVAR_4768_1 [Eumeta japonica]
MIVWRALQANHQAVGGAHLHNRGVILIGRLRAQPPARIWSATVVPVPVDFKPVFVLNSKLSPTLDSGRGLALGFNADSDVSSGPDPTFISIIHTGERNIDRGLDRSGDLVAPSPSEGPAATRGENTAPA